MPRHLLVTADFALFDDLTDRLDLEVVFDIMATPSAEVWRAASVVLVDGRRPSVLRCLPTRPFRAVLVDSTWSTDPDTWADLGVSVYTWPGQADQIRALVTATASQQPAVPRLGVVGTHGGAGATTLTAALGIAATAQHPRVTLVELERDGEGLAYRLGESGSPHFDRIHVVGSDQVPTRPCAPLDLGQVPEPGLAVFDLGRAADPVSRAWASSCDLVFVVADAVRNRHATRATLRALTDAGVPVALVARRMVDQTADLLAGDFTIPVAGDVFVEECCFAVDGAIRERRSGTLIAVATDLLSQVPDLIAEVTAR